MVMPDDLLIVVLIWQSHLQGRAFPWPAARQLREARQKPRSSSASRGLVIHRRVSRRTKTAFGNRGEQLSRRRSHQEESHETHPIEAN